LHCPESSRELDWQAQLGTARCQPAIKYPAAS
jgi:hypothetical protein